jgi:hypothetical protein
MTTTLKANAPPGNANARRLTGRREELTSDTNYSSPRVSQRESALLWRLAILRIIQRPFGAVFWWFEQRIAQVEDRLANESSAT